jgi:hypothetical protein
MAARGLSFRVRSQACQGGVYVDDALFARGDPHCFDHDPDSESATHGRSDFSRAATARCDRTLHTARRAARDTSGDYIADDRAVTAQARAERTSA